MKKFNIGDIVSRESHGNDLFFKVTDIKNDNAGKNIMILRGIEYRIEADALENDLNPVSREEIEAIDKKLDSRASFNNKRVKEKKHQFFQKNNSSQTRTIEMFDKKGKILHVDGASDFIGKCKTHYSEAGLNAVVVEVPEKEQPLKIRSLLETYNPDILVLTGHDGIASGTSDYSNLSNYRNSIYFINAVKEARKYEKSFEDLVIFAGACQSDYEGILDAGANFCSSPKRVLIHMYDPVTVAEKVAIANIDKVLKIDEIIKDTKSGFDGIGGFQTRGKARIGGPKRVY